MSLRHDDRGWVTAETRANATARRRPRWAALALLAGVGFFLAASPARAQESSAELERRMDELLAIDNLTPEQEAELIDVLERYEAAVERENAAKGGATPAPATPAPAPTPTARTRRPTARATPAPAPNTDEPQAEKPPPPIPITPTPTPRPTSRTRRGAQPTPNPQDPGAGAGAATPGTTPGVPEVPAGPSVKLESDLNEFAANLAKPYRERDYRFSIKDGTYADLIEAFSRMANLPVVGEAPQGTVSLVSSTIMDFSTALGRVQMLLFNHPEQYWIVVTEEGMLEVARVSDGKRKLLREDQIFTSLGAYQGSSLGDNELALLLYAPETGSIADLEPIRDFMPDYMQIAQYGTQNALTIFGLVQDINKYLSLIEKFQKGILDSPLRVKIVEVQHVLPSQALEMLRQLVEGFDQQPGAPATNRRGNQPSVAEAQARGITAIANDERGTLLVYAMPAKIEEIEKFLVYVDVPVSSAAVDPVVVRIEHAAAGEVLTLVQSIMDQSHAATGSAAQPTPPRRPRRGRAASNPQPAGPAATASMPDLSMIEWTPANAIILLGEEEAIAEAQALIARFDVPDEKKPTFVAVQHRDTDELVALITQLLQPVAPGLTCTADAATGRIALTGPQNQVDKAVELIHELDVESEAPDVHTIRLVNTLPSSLIPILTTWDSEGTASAPAAPAPRPRRGNAARPRTIQAGNKFTADDAQRLLYVICTAEEWTDKYEPMIRKLDEQLRPATDSVTLELAYIGADEAITNFEQIVPSAKGGDPNGPTYLPVPNGVMVRGASETQLGMIRELLAEIDIDALESGLEVRRIFEIQRAEPQEVLNIVQSIHGGSGAAPAPRPRRGGAQVVTPVSTGASTRFALSGSRLWVWAPPKQMEEIAVLIAELDAEEGAPVMKVFTFAPGTDVAGLAQTLTQFFPDSGTIAPAAPQPGRRGRPRGPTGAAPGAAVLFVPQPDDFKIVVSAPEELLPKIEETIALLRPDDAARAGLAVRFFPIDKGDVSSLAEMISPLAQLKLEDLIAAGAVKAPEGQAPALNITADPAARRLVVAAPAALMPEIATLLDEFAGGVQDDIVVRRVVLEKTSADEMAMTVNAMLTGSGGSSRGASAPQMRPRGGRRGQRGPQPPTPAASVTTVTSTTGVTVTSAPGGNALVLVGPQGEVDKVEGWIKNLDAEATGSKVMKVYANLSIDATKLADEIMTMFDSAPPAKEEKSEDTDWFSDWGLGDWGVGSSGGPQRGADISLTTDYYSNTLVVWAAPRILKDIDEYVALYEKGTIEAPDSVPTYFYDLKIATDAYDAKYELSKYVDAIRDWKGGKPSLDYVSGTPTLIIAHRDQAEVDRVIELINKYVDKPGKEGPTRVYKPIADESAALIAAMLKERMGGDAEVTTVGSSESSLIETLQPIKPCVLPTALTRSVVELGAVGLGQTNAPEQATPSRAELLNELVRQRSEPAADTNGAVAPEEIAPAAPPAPVATPAPTPAPKLPLQITVDPLTNTLIIDGDPRDVARAEEELQVILDGIEDGPKRHDIRVWVLKYLDPNAAAQIIDSMFNGGAGMAGGMNNRLAQQQMRMQQQLLANMMRQQQQGRQQGQQQGEEQGNKRGGRGGREEQGDVPPEEAPKEEEGQQQQLTGVQVFPFPSLRAIILKAPTELYPAIEKLIATIDRQTAPNSEYKYFKISKMLASEVEAQLKVIFGVEQPTERNPRVGGRQGRNQQGGVDPAAAAVEAILQQNLDLAMAGMEGGTTSTANILITSNDSTNTVLVRGPKQVLDMAERIIEDIESIEPPPILTETFVLQYADATQVVTQLKELFAALARASGGGRRGGGEGAGGSSYHPDEVNAVFVPDAASNSIVVRCLENDLPKIKDAIARLDVPSGTGPKADTIQLTCGDAAGMAKLLESIYAPSRRGNQAAGAKAIQFSGDATSNMIIVSAPPELREEIFKHIQTLDDSACRTQLPTFITVQNQAATVVARVIQEAFNTGPRGSGRVKVSGDDASGRVSITAPKELLPQILELAKEIDVDPNQWDIRTFTLKYARAPEVLTRMQTMVQQLLTQIRGTGARLDPFSASADERTNSLIVMGGPVTFAMVERVLAQIDIEGAQPYEARTLVMVLQKARATEVVNTVRTLFANRKDGIDPPQADANPTTNALTVRGTEAQLKEIQDLIAKLEEVPIETLAEATIQLVNIKADEAAEYLRGWFDERVRAQRSLNTQGMRPADLTLAITAEPGSNQLLLMASAENLERIKARIADIDKEGAGLQMTRATQVYTLRFADPNAVNAAIQNQFRAVRNTAEKDRVDATIDGATQSIVVTASESNHEQVQKLISEMDQERFADVRKRVTYELKSARASAVAQMVNETINKTRQATRTGRPPVTVVPNDDLNMLVLAGSQQEIEEITPLIELLDKEPLEGDLQVMVYPIKYADPGSVLGTINTTFPSLRGQRPEDTVRASYTAGTSSLVVAASAERHKDIEDLLAKIDTESAFRRKTTVITLKEASADELARRLTDILGKTQRRARDDTGMAITANESTNSLLVYANETELAQVQDLVATLDVASAFDREIRSFKLTYVEAYPVREAINELFGKTVGRQVSPRDQISVSMDWGSNSLFVAAAPSKMKEIAEFIAQMDVSGQGGRKVQVVTLKNADPAGAVRALQDMFVKRSQRGEETVSISNPQGTQSLLIKATEKEFADIAAVIEQLDQLPPDESRTTRMFALKFVNADEMQTILENSFRMPGQAGGRGGATLVGDTRITALPTSNSVVVTGSPASIEKAQGLISSLDIEIADAGGAPKIIKLEKAIPSAVEPTLTKIFVEGGTRGGGRGGRGSSTASITPVIVADDSTSSLIVRAAPADYTLIERLALSLDQEGSTTGRFRIIQVASSYRVSDLAASLEATMRAAAPPTSEGGRSGRQSEISVEAIDASNTLILAGDPKQLDVAEALVENLQKLGPAGGRRQIIIKPINLTPEEIEGVIQEMLEQNGSSTGSSGNRGRSSGAGNRRTGGGQRRPR